MSLTNITGIAIGFVSLLLSLIYGIDEISYDKFHPEYDKIHRIVVDWDGDGVTRNWARSSAIIGDLLPIDVPEISTLVRIRKNPGSDLLQLDKKKFYEEGLIFSDPEFFNLFGFELKIGSESQVLEDKYGIVLTEPMATKYFGDENPIGKTIRYDNKYDLNVTGIAKTPPTQSHIAFDFIVSFQLLEEIFPSRRLTHWGQFDMYTYARMMGDQETIEQKMIQFLVERAPSWVSEKMTLKLQPIDSIHLNSHRHSEFGTNGNILYTLILSTTSILIIILAIVNFLNLSIALQFRREKEIRILKTLGATSKSLLLKLVKEGLIISVFALSLALMLSYALLPVMENITNKTFMLPNPFAVCMFCWILVLTVSILSGLIPAFPIRSPQKSLVVRRSFKSNVFNVMLFCQLGISGFLLIGMLSIEKQLEFLDSVEIGFESENILVVPIKDRSSNGDYKTIVERVKSVNGIEHVSFSSSTPGSNNFLTYTFTFERGGREETPMNVAIIDEFFLDTYNLTLTSGEKPAYIEGQTRNEILINQAAVNLLGLTEPLGTRVTGKTNGVVVGVIEDFQLTSLHENPDALILYQYIPTLRYVSIKTATKSSEIISDVSKVWNDIYPKYPIEYYWLNDSNADLYKFEKGIRFAFRILVPMALMISLTGLISFIFLLNEEKAYEYSVRRVIGASRWDVLLGIYKKVIPGVLIASLLTAMISNYALNKWLDNFAYRLDPGIFLFISPIVTLTVLMFSIITLMVINKLRRPPILFLHDE